MAKKSPLKVPFFSDFVKKHSVGLFWTNATVIGLISEAVFDGKRPVCDVASLLGVTPEMIFARLSKERESSARSKPTSATPQQLTMQTRNRGRRKPSQVVKYDRYLESGMGSKAAFWKEDFVKGKMSQIKEYEIDLAEAADQLGVSRVRLRYQLIKVGLHVPKPAVLMRFRRRVDATMGGGSKQHGSSKRAAAKPKQEQQQQSDGDKEEEEEVSSYESIRLKNIEEKQQMLQQLGFRTLKEEKERSRAAPAFPAPKRKRSPPPPRQRSVRIEKLKRNCVEVPSSASDDALVEKLLEQQGGSSRFPCSVPAVPSMKLDNFLTVGWSFPHARKLLNWTQAKVNLKPNPRDPFEEALDGDLDAVDVPTPLGAPEELSVKAFAHVTAGKMTCMDVYPENGFFLVAGGDATGEVGLWFGKASRRGCLSLRPHSGTVSCIQFNPWNPPQTLTSGDDGFLRCVDLSSQKLEIVYQWNEGRDPAERPIGWHAVTSPNHLLVGHPETIYRFDARSGKRHLLARGNGCRVAVDGGRPNVLAIPQDRGVAIADDRMVGALLAEIPLPQQPFACSFSEGSGDLLVSTRSGSPFVKDTVRVYDSRGRSGYGQRPRAEWEARFCDDFPGGAAWHPGGGDVVFFTVDGKGAGGGVCSQREKRLGVGGTAACLVACSVSDGACRKKFSDDFTERRFGIAAAPPNMPYLFLPNSCGDGSVSVVGNA